MSSFIQRIKFYLNRKPFGFVTYPKRQITWSLSLAIFVGVVTISSYGLVLMAAERLISNLVVDDVVRIQLLEGFSGILIYAAIASCGLSTLITFFVVLYASNLFYGPLKRIIRQIEEMGRTGSFKPFFARRHDELYPLVEALNSLDPNSPSSKKDRVS